MVQLAVSIPIAIAIAIMLLWPNHTQTAGIIVAPVTSAGGAHSSRIGILLLIIIALVIVGTVGTIEVSGAESLESSIEPARQEPIRTVPGVSGPTESASLQGQVVTDQTPQQYTRDLVPIICEGAREVTILWSSIDPPQSGATLQATCW